MFRAPVRELAGKNVLVTGAASGIGRAVAEYAADRGAVVHLTDVQAGRLAEVADAIRARGGRVGTAEAADVSDHEQVRRLAALVTAQAGPMDVVLNVAGIAIWGTVRSLEHEHWQRLVETIRIAGIDQQSKAFVRARRHFQRRAVSPERAAEAIWRGALRNRYWIYTSTDIRLAHWLQRYFPPGYALAMRIFNYGANRVLPAVEQARRAS